MISGNPIPAQNGVGAAQEDSISLSVGPGKWLGRVIQVLKGVTCFLSGVAFVSALAAGFPFAAALYGSIFVLTVFSLLSGESNNDEAIKECQNNLNRTD
ncbi:hypothetical protein [Endozoicomonas sp. SCSIO W0465]|uniref:hypothetical protein n=1 Tax=Endozoicomonas sp. SCSIO W0465 TaxID=2918516 RepID=UPI002075FCD4|nr:hypothetical protein [Endozoicomonas sp. SCSIO W0465]USE36730.1 hypothetical protein MJO57_00320 [Endozoicomonas sp. SCSIO W0465]